MPHSEKHDSGTAVIADASVEPEANGHDEHAGFADERRARRFRGSGVSAAERERLLRDVRKIDFAIALRGYDRAAVDGYVEQVNRLIAELEISASPESAVRHALDEVSEETRDLLQRAHDTADDITARSRAKADERLERAAAEAAGMLESAQRKAAEVCAEAQREADELRAMVAGETAEIRETAAREAAALRDTAEADAQQLRALAQRDAEEARAAARREAEEMLAAAEGRARELTRNAETVWRERRRLIDDMRAVGEQLVAIGETEGRRFTRFVADTDDIAELEPVMPT